MVLRTLERRESVSPAATRVSAQTYRRSTAANRRSSPGGWKAGGNGFPNNQTKSAAPESFERVRTRDEDYPSSTRPGMESSIRIEAKRFKFQISRNHLLQIGEVKARKEFRFWVNLQDLQWICNCLVNATGSSMKWKQQRINGNRKLRFGFDFNSYGYFVRIEEVRAESSSWVIVPEGVNKLGFSVFLAELLSYKAVIEKYTLRGEECFCIWNGRVDDSGQQTSPSPSSLLLDADLKLAGLEPQVVSDGGASARARRVCLKTVQQRSRDCSWCSKQNPCVMNLLLPFDPGNHGHCHLKVGVAAPNQTSGALLGDAHVAVGCIDLSSSLYTCAITTSGSNTVTEHQELSGTYRDATVVGETPSLEEGHLKVDDTVAPRTGCEDTSVAKDVHRQKATSKLVGEDTTHIVVGMQTDVPHSKIGRAKAASPGENANPSPIKVKGSVASKLDCLLAAQIGSLSAQVTAAKDTTCISLNAGRKYPPSTPFVGEEISSGTDSESKASGKENTFRRLASSGFKHVLNVSRNAAAGYSSLIQAASHSHLRAKAQVEEGTTGNAAPRRDTSAGRHLNVNAKPFEPNGGFMTLNCDFKNDLSPGGNATSVPSAEVIVADKGKKHRTEDLALGDGKEEEYAGEDMDEYAGEDRDVPFLGDFPIRKGGKASKKKTKHKRKK